VLEQREQSGRLCHIDIALAHVQTNASARFEEKRARIAITIIEMRQLRNGCTVFETPGLKKVFSELGFAVSVEDQ